MIVNSATRHAIQRGVGNLERLLVSGENMILQEEFPVCRQGKFRCAEEATVVEVETRGPVVKDRCIGFLIDLRCAIRRIGNKVMILDGCGHCFGLFYNEGIFICIGVFHLLKKGQPLLFWKIRACIKWPSIWQSKSI